jgi:asparagine synthase (glutamine-hydrolysing)
MADRGSLRKWTEDLLEECRLRAEGIFHPAPIRQKWREYLTATCNWRFPLRSVL